MPCFSNDVLVVVGVAKEMFPQENLKLLADVLSGAVFISSLFLDFFRLLLIW
jgi:hypothetical protein